VYEGARPLDIAFNGIAKSDHSCSINRLANDNHAIFSKGFDLFPGYQPFVV
jgi:hypothetical protein